MLVNMAVQKQLLSNLVILAHYATCEADNVLKSEGAINGARRAYQAEHANPHRPLARPPNLDPFLTGSATVDCMPSLG